MRVLFVEDEADTRLLVGEGLSMSGFRVRTVDDGAEAIRALQEDSYDLVVTDVNMPHGVSGIEVAEEVHRVQPSAKVLIVSGYARAQLPELPEGTRYLAKPYRIGELASMLRTMLGCSAAVVLMQVTLPF